MPFLPVPLEEQPKPSCMSPEHNPPSMMVLKPGLHRWQCPSCGHVTNFTVPEVTCGITTDPAENLTIGASGVDSWGDRWQWSRPVKCEDDLAKCGITKIT